MEQPIMEMETIQSRQPFSSTPRHDFSDVSPSERAERGQGDENLPCPACGGGSEAKSFVYAIGCVEARFPNLSCEKEFAQATARADTAGKTDQQALRAVLGKRENRYLLRQMCWVLSVQGLETYLLHPRDPVDLELLVGALQHTPRPDDIDVVIGVRGPIAPPSLCNGLTIPILAFDQIYSFDKAALVASIPKPERMDASLFSAAAQELFDRIMQLTDNAGATDEHRALNYLAMRYPAVYQKTAEQFGRDFALTSVNVSPSGVSAARNICDVVFSYTNRNSDFTEKFFVRVDVTEEFPFLVTKLSPYCDR